MSDSRKIAAIDIGTNSVLLTIVEQTPDGTIKTLHEAAHITRLGQGLVARGEFLSEAMQRTADQLARYVDRCREQGAKTIHAVGTAAFRMARNRDVFLRQIQKELGLSIEVISGEREAELAFRAAAEDFGNDILVVDIGGGSTEFVWSHRVLDARVLSRGAVGQGSAPRGGATRPSSSLGHPRQLNAVAATGGTSQPLGTAEHKARLTKGWVSDRTRRPSATGPARLRSLSLPIGSVVLHERLVHSDPISTEDYELLKMTVQSELMTGLGSQWGGGGASLLSIELPDKLVALAGTATTLSAMHQELAVYAHDEVHGSLLARPHIDAIIEALKPLSVAERQKLPGLEAARADVILVGATLLTELMQLLGYAHVTVGDRGVRWGLLYEVLSQ